MRLSIKDFLIVSVLVHTGVWLFISSRPSPQLSIPFSVASAPSFNIALETQSTPRKPAPSPKASPKHHHRHTPSKPHTQPSSKSVATKHKINTAQPTEITQTSQTTSARLAELQRNEIRDRVLSRIRTNLQQYFVYPLLAQRQGWQGRVLLGFSVEANGAIRNIHVAAGSGYPILDSSAQAALARIQNLYEAGNWLQGQRLELQLPVIFRLQGG